MYNNTNINDTTNNTYDNNDDNNNVANNDNDNANDDDDDNDGDGHLQLRHVGGQALVPVRGAQVSIGDAVLPPLASPMKSEPPNPTRAPDNQFRQMQYSSTRFY